jgi:hypothetical protein
MAVHPQSFSVPRTEAGRDERDDKNLVTMLDFGIILNEPTAASLPDTFAKQGSSQFRPSFASSHHEVMSCSSSREIKSI